MFDPEINNILFPDPPSAEELESRRAENRRKIEELKRHADELMAEEGLSRRDAYLQAIEATTTESKDQINETVRSYEKNLERQLGGLGLGLESEPPIDPDPTQGQA